jgi:hypothetical protein
VGVGLQIVELLAIFGAWVRNSRQGNMSKRKAVKTNLAGVYVWRNSETGRFSELRIVTPKKRPTSTSRAEIRRAVRETYAAQKTK